MGELDERSGDGNDEASAGEHPGPSRGLGGMQAAVNAGTTPGSAAEAGDDAADLEAAAGAGPEDVGPAGSQGAGLGGRMDSGPRAGAGPGGPEDVDPAVVAVARERGPGGPTGSQDSPEGDLAEPGQ